MNVGYSGAQCGVVRDKVPVEMGDVRCGVRLFQVDQACYSCRQWPVQVSAKWGVANVHYSGA